MSLVCGAGANYLSGLGAILPADQNEVTLVVWAKVANAADAASFIEINDTLGIDGNGAMIGMASTYIDATAWRGNVSYRHTVTRNNQTAWALLIFEMQSANPGINVHQGLGSTITSGIAGQNVTGGLSTACDQIAIGYSPVRTWSAGERRVAHAAVYNKILTSTERQELLNGGAGGTNGKNPTAVAPANLVFYRPLNAAASGETGSVNALSLSAVGSPTFDGADNPNVDAAGGDPILASGQGSFSLTGQSANLLFNRKLTADYGTYALTGQSANILFNRLVSAAQGSYALTGQDATLTYTQPGVYSLTADSGTYNWTVSDAFADYTMVALHGTYNLTGQDATLTLTGAPPQDYSMTADAGYYSLTGRAAALRWSGAPVVPSSGTGLSMSMRIGL